MGYQEMRREEALKAFAPQTKQPDYDQFWEETIAEARKSPRNIKLSPYFYPGEHVVVKDLSFDGFDGQRVKGWYIVPVYGKRPFPCVVFFHGGNGWRGNPHAYMSMVAAGFAVVTIDPRGQTGDTMDNRDYSSGYKGFFITRGLMDPYEHYLRGLYMDCMLAVDVAASFSEIDESRIIVKGASQGGACAMAAAAFSDKVGLAITDVPSYCNFPRRIENRQATLENVADYLARYPERTDQVMKTLSYFDVINLADRVTCPVYASVGLKDNMAPAEYFIQAYHYIKGPKDIAVYPFNDHGNVSVPHEPRALACMGHWAHGTRPLFAQLPRDWPAFDR